MTNLTSKNNKSLDKFAENVKDLEHHKEQIAEVMQHNPALVGETIVKAEQAAIVKNLKS